MKKLIVLTAGIFIFSYLLISGSFAEETDSTEQAPSLEQTTKATKPSNEQAQPQLPQDATATESNQSDNNLETNSVKKPPVTPNYILDPGSKSPYASTEQFQVEPSSGSANLTIPIAVPSGRKGIQPNISLMYNSGSGNGPLGVGWSLELGSIQRSTKKGVPHYDNTDTFVFVQSGSSQELVNISGNEYRPKIEGAFMKFSYQGTSGWILTDKKGTKYCFGTTQSSQQYDPNNSSRIFKWCLDKVEDLSGNYMSIEYYPNDGTNQIYPHYIYYTSKTGIPDSASARVEFTYQPRPDTIKNYLFGFKVLTNQLLDNIQVNAKIDGQYQLQRKYQLNYHQGPDTGRSMLDNIKLSDANNANLPATVFNYREDLAKNFVYNYQWITAGFGNGPAYAAMAGDFNGDGLADLMIYNPSGGLWDVALNNGAGFLTSGRWLSGWGWGAPLTGDFNGDGLTDIATYDSTTGKWCVALSVGDHFQDAGEWIHTGFGAGPNYIALTGDFNGDGLTDLMTYSPNGGVWDVALNTGNNGFINAGPHWATSFGDGSSDTYRPMTGDFNGDGLTDIMTYIPNGGVWDVALNTGNNGFYNQGPHWADHFGDGPGDTYRPMTGDFNGDGLTDIMTYSPNGGVWDVALNTGNNGFYNQGPHWADHFGDGPGDTYRPTAGDFNGDGLIDIMTYSPNGGAWNTCLNQGSVPDLLFQVDNSVGALTNITYTPSTQYDNTGGDGKCDLPFPLQTVSSVTATDTISGQSYTTRYEYKNGLFDFQDREFRGFGYVKVKDVDNNYSETTFYQDDLFKGRPKEQKTFDASGNLYGKSVNTYSSQNLYPGVDFVYLSKSDNFIYDGDTSGRRTQAQYFYDENPQYGNLTRSIELGEVDINSGSDLDASDNRYSFVEYLYNTDNYLIGVPKTSYLKDSNGTILKQSWFYYDGQGYGVPPVLGNLTKQEDYLEGGINPATSFSYDNYGNLLTTTDALGRTISISYDNDYHIFPLTTTNALGQSVSTAYYGVNGVPLNDGTYNGLWGQVKSATDTNNVTSYSIYDSFGRISKTIGPNDTPDLPTTSVEYNLNTLPINIITHSRVNHNQSPTLDTISFYDGLGRGLQSKTPSEVTGQYVVNGQTEYNSRGLPIKKYLPFFSTNPMNSVDVINSNNPHSTIDYDPMGRAVKSTSPDGTYSSVIYDDWTTTGIDENGHQEKSYLDAFGRLIKKEEYSGSDGRSPNYPLTNYSLYATTLYEYDTSGNLIQTTDAHNNSTTISYDTLGRKVSMIDLDMGTWRYEYDGVGSLIKQTDAQGQIINFTYDNLNRLTNKTDGASLNVNYTYDDAQVTYSKGRLTKAAYLNNDNTQFKYDNLGRESKSIKKVDGIDYEVDRTYDALNRLTSVQYPDQAVLQYGYNAAGQIQEVYGLTSTNIISNGSFETWSNEDMLPEGWSWYSPYGAVSKEENIKKSGSCSVKVTQDTFAGWSRIEQIFSNPQDYRGKTLTFGCWVYSNNSGLGQIYVTDNAHQSFSPTPSQTGTWQYLTVTHTVDSAATFLSFSLTTGGGLGTGSAYFDDAVLVEGGNLSQPQYYVTNVSYNQNNQITHLEYGNGDTTNYTYDPLSLRLTNLKTTNSKGQVLQDLSYLYDSSGNILTITDRVNTGSQAFTYDELNRLITASGAYGNKTYAYNEIGNITSKEGLSYTYSAQKPHAVISLSDGTTFEYDTNGNMQKMTDSKGLISEYLYDSENRLKTVNQGTSSIGGKPPKNLYGTNSLTLLPVASFEYDGDGGRTKKTTYPDNIQLASTTHQATSSIRLVFNFLSDLVVKDAQAALIIEQGGGVGGGDITGVNTTTRYVGNLYEVSDQSTTRHIFLGNTRIASITSGQTYYFHDDHLGSTNLLTDNSGNVKELMEYLPFGGFSRHDKLGNDTERAWFYFTGKELDDETGLYYYGARYYNSLIGKFITPDSIVQNPFDPQSLNHYTYCRNNPVNYTDPTGHSWWKKLWGQVVSAIVGVVTLVTTWNPVLAFQAYSLTNTVISTGQALASGVSIGRAFGSLAAGIGIGLLGANLGIGDIANLGLRMGAFALEGAAIGAAGAAIMGGNVGQGALWGAGFGAATGFLSSQQFTNWRAGDGFRTNANLSAHQYLKAGFIEETTGQTDTYGQFGLAAGEGHASIALKNDQFELGIGKYQGNGLPMGKSDALFGKQVPGGLFDDTNFINSPGTVSYYQDIGTGQATLLNQYIQRGPGTFALTTNCADWALGAARHAGIFVPNNLTTRGFTDPAKIRAWLETYKY